MTDAIHKPVTEARHGLVKGKLGLGDVLFQGVTHMARP